MLPGLSHHGRGLIQQLCLMVCVEGSSIRYVIQHIAAHQPVPEPPNRNTLKKTISYTEHRNRGVFMKLFWPLSHSQESLRTKRSLCVDVHGFAFAAALIDGQLRNTNMRRLILFSHQGRDIRENVFNL